MYNARPEFLHFKVYIRRIFRLNALFLSAELEVCLATGCYWAFLNQSILLNATLSKEVPIRLLLLLLLILELRRIIV